MKIRTTSQSAFSRGVQAFDNGEGLSSNPFPYSVKKNSLYWRFIDGYWAAYDEYIGLQTLESA